MGSASEWAVAAGTLALALVIAIMAWKTRDVAEATRQAARAAADEAKASTELVAEIQRDRDLNWRPTRRLSRPASRCRALPVAAGAGKLDHPVCPDRKLLLWPLASQPSRHLHLQTGSWGWGQLQGRGHIGSATRSDDNGLPVCPPGWEKLSTWNEAARHSVRRRS